MILLYTILFFPAALLAQDAIPSLATKHPNLLLTPDYGIVSDDDLAYDEKVWAPAIEPYDPNKVTGQPHWQCAPIKNVIPKYHRWRGEDGMGQSGITVDLCDLEIRVQLPDALHIYTDRRGHPLEFCESFERNWKKLTKNQPLVCLEGEGGWIAKNKQGKYRLWTWNKLKTKKGCYASFEGECSVAGCAQGKCP